MVKVLIITDKGCEKACASELTELLGVKSSITPYVVESEMSIDDAHKVVYRSQVALRVLIHIGSAPNLDNLDKGTLDVSFLEGKNFKARGEPLDSGLMSQEIAEGVGAWIHKKTKLPVKLDRPDITITAIARKKIDICVDILGKDLSKRDWRIMLSRRSLKSTVAASAAIYSGAKKGETILDPLADDGTLIIETALKLSNTSPRKHDRDIPNNWKEDSESTPEKLTAFANDLRETKAIRINSKLAGVNKIIHSTKVAVDWMDLKLEKGSVDRVLSYPLTSGKALNPKKASKGIDNLMNQVAHVLKKDGVMTCITEKPEELLPAATSYGLKEIERHEISMGKRPMSILLFRGA
ncbi:hypothetical protein GOV11_01850 [Candidatus Woesearchaeota archaeon]|nr:hypothetical protein [Candidatus Woesearchaeota archaeon]